MIPVKQLFRHTPEEGVWGDCYRAAIASLLDLPVDAVPHIYDKGATNEVAYPILNEFLAARGLAHVELAFTGDLKSVLDCIEALNPGLLFLLTGQSRTGCDHVVICSRGRIIHDPSLDDAGIIGPAQTGDSPGQYYWVSFLVPSFLRGAAA